MFYFIVCFVFMEWVRSFVVFSWATVLLRFAHFAKGFFWATLHVFVFYFGQPLHFVIKRILFVIFGQPCAHKKTSPDF